MVASRAELILRLPACKTENRFTVHRTCQSDALFCMENIEISPKIGYFETNADGM